MLYGARAHVVETAALVRALKLLRSQHALPFAIQKNTNKANLEFHLINGTTSFGEYSMESSIYRPPVP